MNNTTQLPAVMIPLPATVTEPQANAWLGMALTKNTVAEKLATDKLAAQAILLKVKESTDHTVIASAMIEFRKAVTAMVDYRKDFTNRITTGIIEPLMAHEKELDIKTNPEYLAASTQEFNLRQAEATKAAEANKRLAEISRFKAHIENDKFKRAAEYRATLRKEISHQYELHLKSGVKDGWDVLKNAMAQLPQPLMVKFNTTILSKEDMQPIFESIDRLDFKPIYEEMVIEFDNTFANFDSDIIQPEKAIEANAAEVAQVAQEEKSQVAANFAMNTFIASADTIVVDGPKIKKTVEVIIVQSMAWVAAVTTHFNVHQPPVTVKKMESLTVGQMAVALGKLATKEGMEFKGLQLKDVEK